MTWRDHAACRSADLETFFIGFGRGRGQGRYSNAELARALALCAGCPVRVECLDYAMTTYQDVGIWGGMIASQRKKLRRARQTPTAPIQVASPSRSG